MLRSASLLPAGLEGDPVLWYANRASGLVLLVLLTVTTAAGVLSRSAPGSVGWPRAATQGLHRNVGLLSLAFLVVHIATAVVDEFVDIRWWHALVPFAAAYERIWLALGVVAFDLLLAVTLTSFARPRISNRAWRGVHLFAYAAWALGAVHAVGMGTDAGGSWGLGISVGCALLVAAAVGVRLSTLRSTPPVAGAPTAEPVLVRRRVSL